MLDLETPTAALFARLSGLSGFNYSTRVAEGWDSTPPAMQPAMMLLSDDVQPYDPPSTVRGVSPPLWKVRNLVIIYAQAPLPQEKSPGQILNELVAAVCNALLKQPNEPIAQAARFVNVLPGAFGTTLGGLCASVSVVDTIKRFEGVIGRVASAHVMIEMIVTS